VNVDIYGAAEATEEQAEKWMASKNSLAKVLYRRHKKWLNTGQFLV